MIRTQQDIYEMTQISRLLAVGLDQRPAQGQMPLEVTEALASAREQMENLPEVISDLNQAFQRFLTLSDALGRMVELARLSSRIEDGASANVRESLEDEFINLAKVVALEAGRHHYAGPHLSVASPAQARSAEKILAYMDPVLENLKHELDGQKSIILEVISETVNFLGVITHCYPDAEGAGQLAELLKTVKNFPSIQAEAAPMPGHSLH